MFNFIKRNKYTVSYVSFLVYIVVALLSSIYGWKTLEFVCAIILCALIFGLVGSYVVTGFFYVRRKDKQQGRLGLKELYESTRED
ncbi:hypothetical protein UT300012_24600 [Paraclostridium bifermentans]